ncbi:MAG: hypothetical protein ACE5D3_05840, partial [Candidatus Binatia bacterium]
MISTCLQWTVASSVVSRSPSRVIARGTALTGAALVCYLLAACGKPPAAVEVVLALPDEINSLSVATIEVDYSRAGAVPVLSGTTPACYSIHPAVDTVFSDDGAGTLTVRAVSASTFSAPADLAVCRMVPATKGLDGSMIAKRLRISVAGGEG